MSGLARLGRAAGRAVARTTRRIEAAVGLVMTFGGIVMLREIGDILSGAQPVSGASPIVPVLLLAVGAVVAIGFGVRFIFKGF